MSGELLDGVRLGRRSPLVELLEAEARDPARPFVRWDGGEWSVGELACRVRACARELSAAGVEPGARVAIMGRNCEQWLAWQFGVWAAGGVPVSLNVDLRGALLAQVLGETTPVVTLAQPAFHAALATCGADAGTVRDLDLLPSVGDADAAGARELEIPPADALAAIFYTSGTSGPSKGVMLPHGYFPNFGAVVRGVLELDERDVAYVVSPFFHGPAHWMVQAALQVGGVVAFATRFSARGFWAEAGRLGATWSLLIGSMLEAIRLRGGVPDRERMTLRRVLGAPLPETSYAYFEDELGILLHAMYGQTEADGPTYDTVGRRRRGAAGWACAGFELAIVDEHGEALSPGEVGQLAHRPGHPNMMMLGYWQRPDATLAKQKDLWYRTGDFATIDADGFLWFRGRMTDSLRRRGENVSAWELEELVRAAPGVEDCAAVGVVDELGGEDEIKLFLVLEPGASLEAAAFAAFCEAEVPRFARPRFVETIAEEQLTRAPGTGVIQKRLLPQQHGTGVVDLQSLAPVSD